MYQDPIVAEIRAIRESYAMRFNYDLDAIYRDLKQQERRSGRKTVSFQSAAKGAGKKRNAGDGFENNKRNEPDSED